MEPSARGSASCSWVSEVIGRAAAISGRARAGGAGRVCTATSGSGLTDLGSRMTHRLVIARPPPAVVSSNLARAQQGSPAAAIGAVGQRRRPPDLIAREPRHHKLSISDGRERREQHARRASRPTVTEHRLDQLGVDVAVKPRARLSERAAR